MEVLIVLLVSWNEDVSQSLHMCMRDQTEHSSHFGWGGIRTNFQQAKLRAEPAPKMIIAMLILSRWLHLAYCTAPSESQRKILSSDMCTKLLFLIAVIRAGNAEFLFMLS